MKEELLHYIWKYKLYFRDDLKTVSGEPVEVLNHGTHNFDAGPDFFNAKIKIGTTIWVGNVEIHVKSSDWYRHNHHKDRSYNNVILQLVYHYDQEVKKNNEQTVPTVMLDFDEVLQRKYEELMGSESWIPCQDKISVVDDFKLQLWFQKLTIERLENKSNIIQDYLRQTNNSWETVFYFLLARNFGFKLNAEPFELLAKSIPISCFAKHKDNLFQIEALLFGQAGFLEDNNVDDYFVALKKEYHFLRSKFKLKPIEKHLWKFLRTRPNNFPTIRIAQFAQLIYKSKSLLSKVLEIEDQKEYQLLFEIGVSEYWLNHFMFDKESKRSDKLMGKSAIDNIIINTVSLFLFNYGSLKGDEKYKEDALGLLENTKAESNSIIRKWGDLGVKARNAFESQALIELKNCYCNQKKCLNCQIGNVIITS